MSLLKSNTYSINKKNKADGLKLLADINNETISVAFFDPQYRGVLDKMHYGQHRMKDRCSLVQMNEEKIKEFVEQINRVLKKSGYLFLWVDKFHLTNIAENFHNWIYNTDLQVVDMITWNKERMGMGYRTRRVSEYLIVLQKTPTKAKSTWTDHGIPDVWSEKVERQHTHSKPIGLQQRLIEATTKEGDYVLDPASGGYSVFEACKNVGRDFIGGDIEYGE